MDKIRPKEKFNSIISDTIKPILKENGFGKKSLTFYKRLDTVVFVINVQNSLGNSWDCTKFYINRGIYSRVFDKTVGKDELKEPKEYECHFRVRISTITNSQDQYKIDDTTNLETFKDKLIDDINIALRFFEKIKDLEDLKDLILNYSCWHTELFEYLVLTNDIVNIKKQVKKVNDAFKDDKRLTNINQYFNQILRQHNQEITVEDILND